MLIVHVVTMNNPEAMGSVSTDNMPNCFKIFFLYTTFNFQGNFQQGHSNDSSYL